MDAVHSHAERGKHDGRCALSASGHSQLRVTLRHGVGDALNTISSTVTACLHVSSLPPFLTNSSRFLFYTFCSVLSISSSLLFLFLFLFCLVFIFYFFVLLFCLCCRLVLQVRRSIVGFIL